LAETLDVDAVVNRIASSAARRYAGFVEKDDLAQEARIWMLENPGRVRQHQRNPDVKLAAYALGQDMWNNVERYAKKQKARASGYEPDDEVYFSHAMINLVLPSVLRDDTTPPVQAGERIANTSDPAEGGNWMATWVDVKQAWLTADLTKDQRQLLWDYYFEEETQQELGDRLGVTKMQMSRRLQAARLKLIEKLGGLNPNVKRKKIEDDQSL
jgi:RNA polymerase sigma factor (sigma-70 family)